MITVLVGLYICLVLVWIGVDCWVMCGHVQRDNETDTKFEYMYLCKYPEKTVPVTAILQKKIRKVSPAEILKNRE